MKKIYEWFKKNIGYIITAIGGFFMGIFLFIRRGGNGGLDSHKQQLQATDRTVGDAQKSADRVGDRLTELSGTGDKLKQSLDRSQDRVSNIKRTTEQLSKSNQDVGAIINKYNKGLQEPSSKK